MKIDTSTGWIEGVRHVPSPNFDARPDGRDVDLLVIHSISLPPGRFSGPYIDQLFTNSLDPNEHPYFAGIADLTVSAHLLVRRDGEVVQYVSLNDRAWHAGVSCYEQRERCNDFSIGIELEGDDAHAYEPVQYEKLVEITQLLLVAYPQMSCSRIVGHCDIAPDRKTDPGPLFDWETYRSRLTEGHQ